MHFAHYPEQTFASVSGRPSEWTRRPGRHCLGAASKLVLIRQTHYWILLREKWSNNVLLSIDSMPFSEQATRYTLKAGLTYEKQFGAFQTLSRIEISNSETFNHFGDKRQSLKWTNSVQFTERQLCIIFPSFREHKMRIQMMNAPSVPPLIVRSFVNHCQLGRDFWKIWCWDIH
jgi:hypothetical protein